LRQRIKGGCNAAIREGIAGVGLTLAIRGFSVTPDSEIPISHRCGLRNAANYGLPHHNQSNVEGAKMKRGFAVLLAAATLGLMMTGSASAQMDTRTFMDPNFHLPFGGASSIPRTTVNFNENYAPGTIVINTRERRLYLVQPNGTALRYGIGVGRDGFRWSGTHRITAKKEWPDWTPPAQMLRRRPDLPRHMKGGIENPLGARAMYLGSTLYRIHGSNEPETIGQAVSSGCFRMTNDDVTDLYSRVPVGTTVVVKN
jgi:lipoprotein-anchoring transpeptidase ErfK/SrfK